MRGAMPNEESVLLLMSKTAMDKKSYLSRSSKSTWIGNCSLIESEKEKSKIKSTRRSVLI